VIRQIYPLSALLFLLSVYDMALRMQSNKDMKGINIKLHDKNHSIKVLQFANDTTLFISLKEEISFALNEIEILGWLSGLMLNRNKTQEMSIRIFFF